MKVIFLSAITPWLSKWLASSIRLKLLAVKHYYLPRILGKQVKADVYLAFDDPYSYLLIQTLPELAQRYHIEFNLKLTNDRQPGMNPVPKLWRNWALKDAIKLAELYQLNSPQKYPSETTLVTAQQMWQLERPSLETAIELFEQAWHGEFDFQYAHSTPVINHLIKNQLQQASLGHYAPGTIFLAGQWFQGVERLDHFELLLQRLSNKNTDCYFTRDALQLNETLPIEVSRQMPEIDVYLSIRSPYSHLGLIRVKQLADHYQIKLNLKPVLPMVMRGLPVPLNKMIYLFTDTVREAKKYHIPYGNLCDPLGQGVINCYQLFAYAKEQEKEFALMAAIFEAINVHAKPLTSIAVLKDICKSIDMDYEQAVAYNKEADWNIWADQNSQALTELGFWGVPCFKFAETAVWGQDRLWCIEQAILSAAKKIEVN